MVGSCRQGHRGCVGVDVLSVQNSAQSHEFSFEISDESGSIGGVVRREPWIPTGEVITQLAVNDAHSHLQQQVRAAWIPAHLLRWTFSYQ